MNVLSPIQQIVSFFDLLMELYTYHECLTCMFVGNIHYTQTQQGTFCAIVTYILFTSVFTFAQLSQNS